MRFPDETDHRAQHHLTDKTAWVFDLDNTLYPPAADLFGQMNLLMSRFIAHALGVSKVEADQIRQDTWQSHGTTLSGLIDLYNIDPTEFLNASHQLDLSVLSTDPQLAAAIAALPGQKVIHTNGPRAHADRVLNARGLSGLFSEIVAIENTGHISKPDPRSTAILLDRTGISPRNAVMIEDQVANLREPALLGMATVWVTQSEVQIPDHVHHMTRDLTAFLQGLVD